MALTDKLTAIANAIRAKTGQSGALTLPQMASAIAGIIDVDSPVTYSQVNTTISTYLTAAESYSASDYTVSYASDYDSVAAHRPAGATVNIKSAGTLYLYDGVRACSQTVAAGNTTLYNVTPGKTGYFVVTDSNGNITQAGALKPSGRVRMLYIDNIINVRDLGGWTCDGGTVKYGKLFRGAELTGTALPSAQISENGRRVMRDLLGIDYECDFRSDSETYGTDNLPNTADDIKSSALGDDVDYIRFPILYYESGVNLTGNSVEITKSCLLFVMERVINGDTGYFHCMYGRDRTGTLACILLALLGVAQTDIDKDYELTSFIGSATGLNAYRTGTGWTGLINYFNTFSGSTFRDKVVNWAVQLGIPVATLNAYRTAMIEGTPTALSPTVSSYTVTNTLSNVTSDNSAQSATQYQPYTANITPDNGKVITGVTVTMGGTDITDKVFSGTKTLFRYAVTNSLTNCTTDNTKKAVVNDEGYGATITPDSGYTLDGATVTITMGGINVSNYYSNGKIAIPRVTGNIAITITAASSAPPYTNVLPSAIDTDGTIFNGTGYADGYRLGSSGSTTALSQSTATGYIPVSVGDVVRFTGVKWNADESGADRYSCYFHEMNSSFASVGYKRADSASITKVGDVYVYTVEKSAAAYVRFNGIGSGANLIVTINEEIV